MEVAESGRLLSMKLAGVQLQWSRDLEVAESPARHHCHLADPGFNGAATWKSRKVAATNHARPNVDRFNGAATWKSRKVSRNLDRFLSEYQLQWSRDLEVAESEGFVMAGSVPANATMEPRLGSRGMLQRLQARPQARCFNGAATWKSRKAGLRRFQYPFLLRFNGAATWKSRKGTMC